MTPETAIIVGYKPATGKHKQMDFFYRSKPCLPKGDDEIHLLTRMVAHIDGPTKSDAITLAMITEKY